jgi:hypothetical protein
MTKLMMTLKCTSVAANFEGLVDAPEQYRWYCPMQRVQGYFGSHCTPASGDYLLHIAPAATRATGIQTTINKHTIEDGHFNGHGDARRSRASIEATGRCHWASITPDNIVRTWLRWFFSMFSSSKPQEKVTGRH